jgi:hypothetical protein
MDEIGSSPPSSDQDGDLGLSTGAKVGIVIGIIAGVVILTLILGFMLGNPATTETLRDVAIIVLALQSQIILILLAILIYQLVVLIRMLRDDVKPMIESTQETLNTVRGTTTFVSDRVAKPAIAASSYLRGIGRSIAVLFALRPGRRPRTPEPPSSDEPTSEPNETVAGG